jgi:hypothetical protein
MKVGKGLSVISHAINMFLFIYFSLTLIKINALNTRGLFISAFGIFASLIANIISVLESS